MSRGWRHARSRNNVDSHANFSSSSIFFKQIYIYMSSSNGTFDIMHCHSYFTAKL